jgi:MFS-type transporter involved in bile tolerance (Atg22 family)
VPQPFVFSSSMKFNKIQRSWAMYDWANSVYSLVISTVLLPIYYEAVTKENDARVIFLGSEWENTVIYNYVIAASFFHHIIKAEIRTVVFGLWKHFTIGTSRKALYRTHHKS